MLASFLITFRETLEASLVIGIILAYLQKTKNTKYNNVVYVGVGAGILGSVIVALIFNKLAGGFTGRAEEIFEGTTMLVGAVLLTTMIFWMMQQKHVAQELKDKVAADVHDHDKWGLFFLAFVAVLREGVETVIFLGAASFLTGSFELTGGILGIAVAIFLGYLMFVAAKKVNIKRFFNISSVLLILFAAGLVAHGVHEFQEAGVVPTVVEHVWNLNPAAPYAEEGIYPALHEKGSVGLILKGLFGYNGDPSLIEVLAYTGYVGVVLLMYRRIHRKVAGSTR